MRRHPLWAITFGAFALRSAYVLIVRPDPLNMIDSAEYDALARGILAGHGITNLITFARPPLYPLFVAVCYVVGGIGALVLAQLLLSAATAPLVGSLARALTGRPTAGIAAAAVVAIYPWFFQWVGGLASETLFTFLLVSALTLIFRANASPRAGPILLAGVAFGVASLTRANALVLGPPIALWWWWRAHDLRPPLVLALGVFLALVPYAVYNLANGNGPVLASNGGGLQFYIGNNPDTVRLYDPATPEAEWRALSDISNLGPAALEQVGCAHAAPFGQLDEERLEAGECLVSVPSDQREAFWYRGAFEYIRTHPSEWTLLELRKLAHYWRPWVEPRAYSMPVVVVSGLSFGALLLLALAGLRSMPRGAALFVLAVAAGSTLSSVVWNVYLRYRFAMLDPILIAAAGQPLVAIVHRLGTQVPALRGSAKPDDVETPSRQPGEPLL